MARANFIEDLKRIVKEPKSIRNIAICAHIDHGKCIDGKSRVLLADGDFVSAKEIFSLAAASGKKVKENENEIIYDISQQNIRAYSLNKKTAKIEKKSIQYAWKLKGGELLSVTLRNGLSISTTPEHKYLTFNGAAFVEREAGELKKGDRVVCSRRLDVDECFNLKNEILKRLSASQNFYVYLNKKYGAELKKRVLKYGINNLIKQKITHRSAKNFYHGCWKHRYNLADLLRLANILNINLEEIYSNIDSISHRTGKKEGKNSISIKLPRNFENFFYLAGLLVGDGSGTKLVAGKKDLAEKFDGICRELGMKPYWRNYEGKCPEICSGGGKTIFMILNSLFGYPERQKSRNVFVSEFLKKSPKKCIANFIQAYFDCDGTIEKARSAISLTSASPQMLSDLQLLLLRFGCASIRQGDTIYISGSSVKSFAENIGFFMREKQEKMNMLLKTAKSSLVSDLIPLNMQKMAELRGGVSKAKVGHHYYKYENSIYVPTLETFGSIMASFEDAGIDAKELSKFVNNELAFIEVKEIKKSHADEVFDFTIPENHNFIAEGMIIHNTTLSDNLLSGAGMISEELAGKQCFMDFDKQEQERGITIYSANVSMIHSVGERDYVINLIDTPGHVDFGGDVTRAMRAVDGCVVVVCAVEGAMPQTETVLRQALKERVKPILFINKVDRLIRELKLSPEEVQQRFVKHINNVNALIKKYAPAEHQADWMVDVNSGKVVFGSAYHNWAISIPYMKKSGITFKDIFNAVNSDTQKEFAKKSKAHEVLLDAVIHHLPSPMDAQGYRIGKIWTGTIESLEGKSMSKCDPNGPLVGVVTNVSVDIHAGSISTVRLFSGTIKEGQSVYLISQQADERVQQVGVYAGPRRVQLGEIPCGNIIAISGLSKAFSGETICSPDAKVAPFESIKHIFEPVVTKSIEVKDVKNLPKMIELLRQRSREDPTIAIKISESTGETLVSGLGELHIEAKVERFLRDRGIDIIVSKPIVIYKESVLKESNEFEGKSPNKHNKFYIKVAPMPQSLREAMETGLIEEGKVRKQDVKGLADELAKAGMDRDEAKKVIDIYSGNILINATRGIVQLNEVYELLIQSFREIGNQGPLAAEPATGLLIYLTDAKLHEDAIHRGPAQVLPAVKGAIRNAMVDAEAVLLEPKQILRIDTPVERMGDAMAEVQNRRGQILDMTEESGMTVVKCKLPVAEMFGFEGALKSATGGRGFQSLIDITYEKLPNDLQDRTILAIRKRKGMKEELPKVEME